MHKSSEKYCLCLLLVCSKFLSHYTANAMATMETRFSRKFLSQYTAKAMPTMGTKFIAHISEL